MYRESKKYKGKIMVLGYLGAKIDDYLVIAAYYNIPRDAITFINDPNNFRIKKIFDSEYTDLCFSAWPHCVEGSSAKNLPRTIKDNPTHYPKLWTKAESGSALKKLSISDFEIFLKQTEYIKINKIKLREDLEKGLEKYGGKVTKKTEVKKPQAQNAGSKKPRTGTSVSNYFKEFEKKYGC